MSVTADVRGGAEETEVIERYCQTRNFNGSIQL